MWHELENRRQAADGAVDADVCVPESSAWFDGHFPGHPVLPGIAQLGMVADLIRAAWDHPARVVGVSRVRFKQKILPEDRLQVTVEPRPDREGVYGFRITKNDAVACSGTMTVAPIHRAD